MWIDQYSDGCVYDTVDCYHDCPGCRYGIESEDDNEDDEPQDTQGQAQGIHWSKAV